MPSGVKFEPLMTLYVTDTTPAAEVERAQASGCVLGCRFFFSSRSRHTRCSRDWSSDVCSSDLQLMRCPLCNGTFQAPALPSAGTAEPVPATAAPAAPLPAASPSATPASSAEPYAMAEDRKSVV